MRGLVLLSCRALGQPDDAEGLLAVLDVARRMWHLGQGRTAVGEVAVVLLSSRRKDRAEAVVVLLLGFVHGGAGELVQGLSRSRHRLS